MIDASVAGSTTNCYVDLSYADTFFANSVDNASWPIDDEKKEAALIESTRILDSQFNWIGTIATAGQALRWPREAAIDQDGRLYPVDLIPIAIQNAVCYLAYFLLQTGGLVQTTNDLREVKIGAIDIKFAEKTTAIGVPRFIVKTLQHLGVYTGALPNSVYNSTAVRS